MRTEKPVHYLQYDTRWGGIMFSSHGDKSQTIKSSGCGATSSAMVLAMFKDAKITPLDVAQVILDAGYRTYNNGVDWGWFLFMAKHYSLILKETTSTDEVIQALKNDALVVASMGAGYFTKTGHYIVLWGLDEVTDQILVNDPNSTTRIRASYDLFRQQAVKYFIFEEAKKVPEKWQTDILEAAKEAGLITSVDHDPLQKLGEIPLWFFMATLTNFLKAVKG